MGKASRTKRGQRDVVTEEATQPLQTLPHRHTLPICIALVLFTLLVFGRTAFNGYIEFDDPNYVSHNLIVQHGLTIEGLKYVFTAVTPYYWQPLTWISHEIDATLFGTRPGPQHVESVLLHGLTAALLFLFLQRTTGRTWPPAIAAAIWAVHPLRVESVAWIAERKDILSGLFFVATLLAYERYVRKRTAGGYVLVLAMYVLSMMAKPSAVTAPLVLLLLNFWPFRRFDRRTTISALAPLVLAIPIVAATFIGQRTAIAPIAFSLRLFNAIHSTAAYLGKLVLPIELAVIYPFRDKLGFAVVFSAVLIIAISLAVWRFRASRPYLAMGWGWYLAMLIPVVGLVQSGAQAMADRFTYMPSMGVIIAVVWLCGTGSQPVRGREAAAVPAADGLRTRPTLAVVAAIAIAAFSAVSVYYAGLWRDTTTLFTHAITVTEDNSLAHLILGNVLLADKQYDAANNQYAEAIRTSHGGAIPLEAAGTALIQQKRYLEAVDPLQRALDVDPNNLAAHQSLAVALIRTGRAAAALPHLDAAQKLDPSRAAELTSLRAEAQLAMGKPDEALAGFQQALQANPTSASWNDLGTAYASKNDFPNAERAYREAIRLDANNYDARMNYSAMLSRAGRNDEAVAQVREAARIVPDSVEPRVYLALIEAQLGRFADAANDAAEAQRIDAKKANEILTSALRMPPRDSNLSDFVATMRAR